MSTLNPTLQRVQDSFYSYHRDADPSITDSRLAFLWREFLDGMIAQRLRDTEPETWGAMQVGRWAVVEGYENVQGVCAFCFRMRDAFDLELRDLPFGRGQVWVCRHHPGGKKVK